MALLVRQYEFTQGTVVDGVPWKYISSEQEAPLGIVLSNPCDLEHDKASFILIACLVPARATIYQSKEFIDKTKEFSSKTPLSKSRWETISKFMSAYIHNTNINRYFFIDPTKIIEAPYFFVDFQNICVVPMGEKEKLEIVGLLPVPFKEKMIMHFASYISRIGVDRVEDTDVKTITSDLAFPFKSPE